MKKLIGFIGLSFLCFDVDAFSDDNYFANDPMVIELQEPTDKVSPLVTELKILNKKEMDRVLRRNSKRGSFQKIYTQERGYTWIEGQDDSDLSLIENEA